jgi:hypothetical protein
LAPKEQYHSPNEVSLGISLAVAAFNDGWRSTMIGIMRLPHSPAITDQAKFIWNTLDKKRIVEGNRASDPQIKEGRKERRKAAKKAADGFQAAEGVSHRCIKPQTTDEEHTSAPQEACVHKMWTIAQGSPQDRLHKC